VHKVFRASATNDEVSTYPPFGNQRRAIKPQKSVIQNLTYFDG
jgi:hypothetical protein